MAKQIKRRAPAAPIVLKPVRARHVWLIDEAFEFETLRRLAHLVVDILADRDRYEGLADTLGGDLGDIADEAVIVEMVDFVDEACGARVEVCCD